jgi:glutathione S-transferase
MKLHGHPASPSTRLVLTTLAEKGHEAELILVDPARGASRSPEHLVHQPFGLVPVLEDGDFVLYESRAICRYVNEKLPGPSLVPATVEGRARMEQFISIEQSHLSGAILTGPPADLVRPLDVLDRALERGDYLAGTFSLADIFYIPAMDRLFLAGQGHLLTSRHHLAAWWGRLRERPSWKKVTGQ